MTVICYFAAEMLIRRSLRVFRKSWKGLAAACAVTVLLCVIMGFDVFGFERYVPEAEKVESVSVNIFGWNYAEGQDCTDEETVLAAIAAHEMILDHGRPGEEEKSATLYVAYTMTNGRKIERKYRFELALDSDLQTALNKLGNTESVQRCTVLGGGRNWTPEMIRGGYITGEEGYCQMTTEQARALYDALHWDMVANSNSWDVLKEYGYLYYDIEFEGSTDMSFYVGRIPASFTNTLQVIESMDLTSDGMYEIEG